MIPSGNDGALNRKKILLDLKPAFDGYSGIPQETRLLFAGLRQLDTLHVQGLIQHGGRQLRAGLKKRQGNMPVSRQIYQLSRLVVSANDPGNMTRWKRAREGIDRYFALQGLRLRAALGLKVPHSIFDSRHFPDFVWRTFFEKTLKVEDKDTVSKEDFCVLQPPRLSLQKAAVSFGSSGACPRFPVIDTRGFDVFLAQTPFPGRLARGTKMVVRYHDAVPLLMPHTIKDKAFHQKVHYQGLLSNVENGAIFSCVSRATQNDLLTLFPQLEKRSFVIHNMVSDEYHPEISSPALVPRLVKNRLADSAVFSSSVQFDRLVPESFEYLLMVGTIEPRKNHTLLLSAWERLKYTIAPDLKLVLVGGVGWDEKPLLRAFKPWALKGDLFYLQNVPSAELRVLYTHALLTVAPSLSEGFDYSGVEAMRCGCPVAASDIPVHREIYQDGAAYFDPYSIDHAVASLARLTQGPGAIERRHLAERGRLVSDNYLPARLLPAWQEFFNNLD